MRYLSVLAMRNVGVLLIAAVIGVCGMGAANAVTYDLRAVGDAGNAPDGNGHGAVGSAYAIGTYEVTIGQYVEFLNAVAATDTNGLFNTNMDDDKRIRGIVRSGTSGSYTYAAAGPDGTAFGQSAANRPITFVSWNNAARFANWMSNGQPTGSQSPATTEDGAYDLTLAGTSAIFVAKGTNPNTNAAPLYVLPTSDQWYKAAYYNPTLNGGSGGYYDYATQSDTAPGNTVGGGSNQANVYNNGYSLTGLTNLDSTQNYLTDVGAYSGSASYYGTFDQTGNTSEWTSTQGSSASEALLRGGDWNAVAAGAGNGVSLGISVSNYDTGFRLASTVITPVPEPAAVGIALSAAACGWWRLRRRKGPRSHSPV